MLPIQHKIHSSAINIPLDACTAFGKAIKENIVLSDVNTSQTEPLITEAFDIGSVSALLDLWAAASVSESRIKPVVGVAGMHARLECLDPFSVGAGGKVGDGAIFRNRKAEKEA